MKYSTAVHESGHVILAILLGVPWQSATIRPMIIDGQKANGVVDFFGEPENTDDLIRILLSGYAAEEVSGLPVSYGSRVEFEQCVVLARSIDPEPKEWTEALLWNTKQRLKANKEALENLASFLLWMETITPDALDLVSDTIQLK